MTTTIRFEVGKTYCCRSVCDHDCIFRFEIIARTAKTVTLRSSAFGTKRRKVRPAFRPNGPEVEACDPLGRYSMSPILTADYTEDRFPPA